MVSASKKNTSNPRLVFSELPCCWTQQPSGSAPSTSRAASVFGFLFSLELEEHLLQIFLPFPQINAKGTKIWWIKQIFSSFPDPSFFSHPVALESRTCLFLQAYLGCHTEVAFICFPVFWRSSALYCLRKWTSMTSYVLNIPCK